jgi:kynurenine 3-monooxygenase
VSRSDLNAILLDAAEATGRVAIEFEKQIDTVDLGGSRLTFEDGTSAPFGVVFGADGAGSPVRQALAAAGACQWHTDWIDHEYKELTLAPGDDGSHQLDPNALHIWPRGEFMLIALANPEGDFTVTFFAPSETFRSLTSGPEVESVFQAQVTDFAALIPDLAEQFIANPSGGLGTIRATGWSFEDRAVVLGDAAHAIVPFHGQGMNAAMESARALDRHLRATPDDIGGAFVRFEAERKPSTDAIADMALDNYVEMRSSVVDPDYLARRAMALELERRHPRHLSPRYNLVMFSTMPYAEAKARAERQAEIIAAALDDPSIDVDRLVTALPTLPDSDPLADPNALSVT